MHNETDDDPQHYAARYQHERSREANPATNVQSNVIETSPSESGAGTHGATPMRRSMVTAPRIDLVWEFEAALARPAVTRGIGSLGLALGVASSRPR